MTLQYFKPDAPDEWVGDCMPFYHAGVFHFFYLLDEGHHQALHGMGGHQWAHASTRDLVTWTHHPLALAITEDEEKSICTGSIFHHGDTYYAFHAVRRPDWTQRLGVATSTDGIHFTKLPVPPHAEPPSNYDPVHYRDPMVFVDATSGLFHQLVTAKRIDGPMPALGGCLAHLVSEDLATWRIEEPFLLPGFTDVPECPDYFEWNGWYYLVFSNSLQARYRMARTPFGPWQRPARDLLDGAWTRVMKTAAYHDNRRLGVAWVGTRRDDRDTGRFQWGGHAVFREVVQQADGTLGTKFPPEMIPATGAPVPLVVTAQTEGITVMPGQMTSRIELVAGEGMAAVSFGDLPRNVRVRARCVAEGTPRIGVRVRESGAFVEGVTCDVLVAAQRVELHDAAVDVLSGLDRPFWLDIVVKDDLIDVCVDERICLINRCPEQRGAGLTFFCHTGRVTFEEVSVAPLTGE